MADLFSVAKRAAQLTPSIIVAFSGGKDSIAVLDVCVQHFRRVEAYFMYTVKGLGFQERYLQYIERRYSITIQRVPHVSLAQMIASGSFRPAQACEQLSMTDVENAMRQQLGIDWIASGEKMSDSLQRRGMLNAIQGLSESRRRVYPLAGFSDRAVFSYLKMRQIPLPPDYRLFNDRSFGALYARELIIIRDNFPEDYELIKQSFPFVEAQVKRDEFSRTNSPQTA